VICNFVQTHKAHWLSPAMAAGLTREQKGNNVVIYGGITMTAFVRDVAALTAIGACVAAVGMWLVGLHDLI